MTISLFNFVLLQQLRDFFMSFFLRQLINAATIGATNRTIGALIQQGAHRVHASLDHCKGKRRMPSLGIKWVERIITKRAVKSVRLFRENAENALCQTALNGLYQVDRALQNEVAHLSVAAMVGPTGWSAVILFFSYADARSVLQQHRDGAYVSMKSSSMQRRIATGAVDGGFRVVAHIHRGAGANQVLYHSTG